MGNWVWMSDNDNKMTSRQLHLQRKQSPVFAARKRDQVNVFHQIPIEQCFFQTPKHWREMKTVGGRLPNEAWRAVSRGRRRRAGIGFLGRGQQVPSPPTIGRLGSAVSSPSGVGAATPTAQRFSTIFSTQGWPLLRLYCWIVHHKKLNKKLSWCWQTGAMRQGHQTWYHSIC